ncbi:NAD(P)/FAD-dependent oxidoreductase [Runella limosa]|uniref:NAD(P)/FAD-dependent oxidoreductase n=1 Tax=Runella limosa TaxID=370978 RepID=UPI000420523E|nr:NAD(P)/FAD-dependent oxidoreductase [Runella limosa]
MRKNKLGIVGGGLAGLSLAIQAARKGFEVTLFEKNTYPFHRVCGEYISLESYDFIERLGVPLSAWNLPVIKELEITSPKGTRLSEALPLGGFGLSRYQIDFELVQIARSLGVLILEKHTVSKIDYLTATDSFIISANQQTWEVDCCVGSFGKKSNLDVAWKRPFVQSQETRLNNYLGVKYHLRTDFPKDKIALHNFVDGYCGISAIEDDKYCLCYLTTAQNLKKSGSKLEQMHEQVLFRNPYLKSIFANADFLFSEPVTISQISFEPKTLVENHVLLLGDAAGMITPLCGNGMSMALHGSKIAFEWIDKYANGIISRYELETQFTTSWNQLFKRRLWVGRQIQAQFGSEFQTEVLLRSLKPFPFIVKKIISLTHGKPF